MNARTSRTAVAAALLLGIAAGPAGPALAADRTPATAAAATEQAAPDAKALRAAIAGLPRTDATAALVRVAGTAGIWRGSSGVHDLESGLPADPGAASGPVRSPRCSRRPSCCSWPGRGSST